MENSPDYIARNSFETVEGFLRACDISHWTEDDKTELAARLLLDCLPQPRRVTLLCNMLDRALVTGE